jgi:predicted nucleotidyltransferase
MTVLEIENRIETPDKKLLRPVNATSRTYRGLAEQFAAILRRELGQRLTSIVLYGSVARGTARQDSDIDLLIMAGETDAERKATCDEIWKWDDTFSDQPEVVALRKASYSAGLEIYVLSKAQARRGTPIYLDMTLEAIVLYDPEGFFDRRMQQIKRRMAELNSYREWIEPDLYVWHLKANLKPGEVFSLPYIEETNDDQ